MTASIKFFTRPRIIFMHVQLGCLSREIVPRFQFKERVSNSFGTAYPGGGLLLPEYFKPISISGEGHEGWTEGQKESSRVE